MAAENKTGSDDERGRARSMSRSSGRTTNARWRNLPDRLVLAASIDVLDGVKMLEIAKRLEERFGTRIDRTQVHHVLTEARRRGILQLLPPKHGELSHRMLDCFGAPKSSAPGATAKHKIIEVVQDAGEPSLQHVANLATKLIFELILEKARKKSTGRGRPGKAAADTSSAEDEYIHIGFGAGTTVQMIARGLAQRMRAEFHPPKVNLHALSSGFLVESPMSAPNLFFSFFDGMPDVKFTGLFSKPWVKKDEWIKACEEEVGVHDAAKKKGKLDIIITSLASAEDEHGELNRWMGEVGGVARETIEGLKRAKRVGDVLYRPFDAEAPIVLEDEVRVASLFELEELVAFAARPETALVLVAGPCGHPGCGRTREDALYPLLTQSRLDLITHLVLDAATAEQVLKIRDNEVGRPDIVRDASPCGASRPVS